MEKVCAKFGFNWTCFDQDLDFSLFARGAVQENRPGRFSKSINPGFLLKPARSVVLQQLVTLLRFLCFNRVLCSPCFLAVSLLSLIFSRSSSHQLTCVISAWALIPLGLLGHRLGSHRRISNWLPFKPPSSHLLSPSFSIQNNCKHTIFAGCHSS